MPPIKNTATLLAAASLGVLSLGATACNDETPTAATTTPSSTSTASTASTVPTSSPPVPQTTQSATTPAPTAAPPTSVLPPNDNQIVLISPKGEVFTRKKMIRMALGMAMMYGDDLPSNFCARSYRDGVSGGGKFPAGKAAYLSACQEGVHRAN